MVNECSQTPVRLHWAQAIHKFANIWLKILDNMFPNIVSYRSAYTSGYIPGENSFTDVTSQ